MASSDLAEANVTISQPSSPNSMEIFDVYMNHSKDYNAESIKSQNPHNEIDDDNVHNDDVDPDCVVIEEPNKAIHLNEESDDGLQLHLPPTIVKSSDVPAHSNTKSTEYVIVNAANLSISEIADEVKTTNKYRTEDVQIKDELADAVTAYLNTNDVLENDPMDLLELNTRSSSSNSERTNGDTDYCDDASSIGSSSVQTGATSSMSVGEWIRDYPWLLYEEGDEPCGYCLYCDAKLNTKSQRIVKQHGLSLYHKERCENYLAFREEEDRNGLGMKLVEIKEEFGTENRVEALKLKRKSQSGALNNFNWRRWLEECPWLERNSFEGTVGFCKYCLIQVNVEFSYLRDRHQEGAKHRDAEKQYEESSETVEPTKRSNLAEEKDKDTAPDIIQTKNNKWLEIVKKEPTMARCKLCGYKMVKNNFLRHLHTNIHVSNERMYLENQRGINQKETCVETTKNKDKWQLYSKHHPWLISDPTDETFAYCKYCEKRIVYGGSAAKRELHENGSQHKHNEKEFKKRFQADSIEKKTAENDTDGDDEESNIEDQSDEKDDINEEEERDEIQNESDDNNEGHDDGDEVTEKENENNGVEDEEEENNQEEENQKDEEREDHNESKKRAYKLSHEWLNQYSWCKKYKKDPTNFIFCIYCRIPLSISYSRAKHQSTSYHISAEESYLNQNRKKKVLDGKQNSENAPVFEWAVQLKNDSRSYSCRYCRVRISKNYSKKQHGASKIHQINEGIYKNNRRKSLRSDENTNAVTSQSPPKLDTQQSNIANSKKIQAFPKVVIKTPSTVTLIKQLQKKFPWLSYKRSELRSHYGFCKICESSLYVRSTKHVLRHLRSARHISIIKFNKNQKVEKEEDVSDEEKSPKGFKKGSVEELHSSPSAANNLSGNQEKLPTTEATAKLAIESQKGYSYKSTIAEMKKRYSWIEKSEKPNYAFCHFCSVNIPLKILFLRNHSNSPKHRHSVINYYSGEGKNSEKTNSRDLDESNSKSTDDVILIEENNDEILISEQDENCTIKSETMDEHEELDYLLQRSFSNNSNCQRNVRKSVNAEDGIPAKRVKRSHLPRRFNNSNSSLIASLLSTPLTLASCLGPLIQQQIQQQANFSQLSQTNYNSLTTSAPEASRTSATVAVEPENTYDLFFKSISETMKKLPVDLATEGKLRVMKVICDLELQHLKRQQREVNESVSSNTASSSLIYQAACTSTNVNPVCNSNVINDVSEEQVGNSNETTIAQMNTNANLREKSSTSATSPIIGVMDKNGLQTLHLKAAVAKQVLRNTTTTMPSISNSGIRCIPFKDLSHPATPDSSNTKVTRIQANMHVTPSNSSPNTNTPSTSKHVIDFRNLQITNRTDNSSTSTAQSPMTNRNSQRTYITNLQPQLQRWGCSVSGPTSKEPPKLFDVKHPPKFSSQQTSTPIFKK